MRAGIPAAAPVEPVFVIQQPGIANTTRLVLLAGDPTLPYRERGGVATVEIGRGFAPQADEDALVRSIVELLEAHGRKQWERECFVRRFVERAHLELVP